MKTLSFKVDPEHFAMVEALGCAKRSDALRRIFHAGLSALQEDEIPPGLDDRTRFIMATELFFHFSRSCKEAKIPRHVASAWLEEEGAEADLFREVYESAQEIFVESVEFLIIEACRNEVKLNKSAITGLIAFLNNRSKDWGRVKIEMIMRILNPILGDYLKILKAKLDEHTFQDISEAFQVATEQRTALFSE